METRSKTDLGSRFVVGGGKKKRDVPSALVPRPTFSTKVCFGPFSGVLAASIDVIGIPKRVLTSPDLAAYVMAEGDDGEEGGRAEARTRRKSFSRLFSGRVRYCFASLDVVKGGRRKPRRGIKNGRRWRLLG